VSVSNSMTIQIKEKTLLSKKLLRRVAMWQWQPSKPLQYKMT
jgi:hypothetical protein